METSSNEVIRGLLDSTILHESRVAVQFRDAVAAV